MTDKIESLTAEQQREQQRTQQREEENRLIAQRRGKLAELRKRATGAFPNDFRRAALAAELQQKYQNADNSSLESAPVRVALAGRMMAKRLMGKASFTQIKDSSGTMQLYLQKNALAEGVYDDFKTWDIGDIIGVEGTLFRTRTEELTVKADKLKLLSKSLRPLPEKFHGLSDQDMRYRQRYVDLIVNDDVRQVFRTRAAVIDYIRCFMNERDYLEVETPMMHPIPGGAAARPFKTYHNALHMDLYLRIAPELYLKRLLVGGFEKVYEINRNFRNEGLSPRHNPEFTMLEFYEAYADYRDFMDLTETMLRGMAEALLGTTTVAYQGETFDLGTPFARTGVVDAILQHNPRITPREINDPLSARAIAEGLGVVIKDNFGLGRVQMEIFEKTVEHKLNNPTFITEFPTEVSPLSRRNDQRPDIAERFELFIGGREIANGFSELNDPEDQAERFRAQSAAKAAGDEEAMHYDADYIRALEYGMPPAAGEGIGIDRLVMLLTDSPAIRDVLLFPQMRPE